MGLIKPVVRAFAAIGLTQKELLGGAIEHTDLGWQTPPLNCQYDLAGAPLQLYLDRHMSVNAERVHAFWLEGLQHMRNAPYKIINESGWRQLSYILPRATQGERQLRFTIPDGFPASTSDYAGITFSMECAHLLRTCTPVVEVVESDDDYYVITAEGHEVGVRNGLPIVCSDEWDLPVNGMVRELLQMPRGSLYVGCDYDLISKLRSVLWDRRERFPEYSGVDMALQALRVLANGQHLKELQTHIGRLNVEVQRNKYKLKALTEAVELSTFHRISDRARVTAIRGLLVPDFMTMSEFRRQIYHSPDNVPALITEDALRKLQTGLEALLTKARLGK